MTEFKAPRNHPDEPPPGCRPPSGSANQATNQGGWQLGGQARGRVETLSARRASGLRGGTRGPARRKGEREVGSFWGDWGWGAAASKGPSGRHGAGAASPLHPRPESRWGELGCRRRRRLWRQRRWQMQAGRSGMGRRQGRGPWVQGPRVGWVRGVVGAWPPGVEARAGGEEAWAGADREEAGG